MKILGISAGTKNGNNDAMCKEALMGAKEMGAEVEFIRLHDLDLKHLLFYFQTFLHTLFHFIIFYFHLTFNST